MGPFGVEWPGDYCTFDSISITDVYDDHEEYCGPHRPVLFHLYSGPVLVRFFSDDSITESGFSLEYIQTGK